MANAVTFEHVSKRYLRGGPHRYRTFRSDMVERIRRIPRRLREGPTPRGTLALHDVTFGMPEGESLGIIGPNGSGKTTALKLITRISYPTEGRIRVRGRVAALIEIGAGIHPELTGRENILLYGRILGMSKEEIRGRFDDIVEFGELGHAIDRQVKMFSSGMQLRLGFSIASHLDPDVLLVDEALAVGDADFQQKCVERMAKLVGEGRSLILVSHDLSAIESTCAQGIFLLDGGIRDQGPIHDVIASYLAWVDRAHQVRQEQALGDHPEEGEALEGVTVHGADGGERYAFNTGEDVEIRLRVPAQLLRQGAQVSVAVREGGRQALLLRATRPVAPGEVDREAGLVLVACRLRAVPLLPRIYEIWGSVRTEDRLRDLDFRPLGTFRIAEGPERRDPSGTSTVHVEADWRVGAPEDV